MATTVLPEPTSPCSRRFIGYFAARPALISAITFSCALVRPKGSCSTNRASNFPAPQCEPPERPAE